MLKKSLTIGYAAALVTSPAWLSACTSQPQAESEEPTVLFSLTSDRVHFENAKEMEATLVMEGVDPHTLWFTDRPAREAGAITTQWLASQWGDGETFDEDPPNAALVLHEPATIDGEAKTDTLVAIVKEVGYNPVDATFRADLKVLTDEEADALEGHLGPHGSRHDTAWPAGAGAVSLFIDSIGVGDVQAASTSVQSQGKIVLCTSPSTCKNSTAVNYTYNQTIDFTTTIGQVNGTVTSLMSDYASQAIRHI